MEQKQIEKKMSDFYQSYYYIFGWFMIAAFGYIYFQVRGEILLAGGFMLGSITSLFGIFLFGYFSELQRYYIKKTGRIL